MDISGRFLKATVAMAGNLAAEQGRNQESALDLSR